MSFQPGANLYTQGWGSRPENVEVPVINTRAPTSYDNNYPVGKRWIWPGNGEWVLNQLSSIQGINTATWQLSNGINNYPITPYVVGPAGQAGYQTIQSAIDDLQAAGGTGTIYIQPGTYNENLLITTLNVNFEAFPGDVGATALADVFPNFPTVIITGNVTINTAAYLTASSYTTFANIYFSPTTGDAFTFTTFNYSASVLNLINCYLIINQANSHAFILDGWATVNVINTTLEENGVHANLVDLPGSIPFGFIYGENSNFLLSSLQPTVITGAGNVDFQLHVKGCNYQSMIDFSQIPAPGHMVVDVDDCLLQWQGSLNEPLFNFGAEVGSVTCNNCKLWQASNGIASSTHFGSDTFFYVNNLYTINTLPLSGDCRDQYYNCTFNTGVNTALSMGSSQNIVISNCTVNTSANPAISGAGTGTLTLSGVEFLNNATLSGTLTLAYANTITGNVSGSNLIAKSAGNGLQVKSGTNARIGTATLAAGTSGAIANTSVTANTHILVTVTVLGTVTAPQAMLITKNAGVGFTITSADATDTSTVEWFMVESI